MNQVYIYCGDDIVSSRKAFVGHIEALKNKNFDIEKIEGKDLTLEMAENLSLPTTLFGQRAIAIENLLSGTKSKEKEKIIERVGLFSSCVIWEGKEIGKTDQIKYPKNFVFKNFKLPQTLYFFLESLLPGKIKENLQNYRKAIEITEPSFLFLMLARQIRLLLLIKEEAMLKMAPWQISRLKNQAKLFDKKELKEIYRKLLEIDYRQKTSSLPFSLEDQLELFIMEI